MAMRAFFKPTLWAKQRKPGNPAEIERIRRDAKRAFGKRVETLNADQINDLAKRYRQARSYRGREMAGHAIRSAITDCGIEPRRVSAELNRVMIEALKTPSEQS